MDPRSEELLRRLSLNDETVVEAAMDVRLSQTPPSLDARPSLSPGWRA